MSNSFAVARTINTPVRSLKNTVLGGCTFTPTASKNRRTDSTTLVETSPAICFRRFSRSLFGSSLKRRVSSGVGELTGFVLFSCGAAVPPWEPKGPLRTRVFPRNQSKPSSLLSEVEGASSAGLNEKYLIAPNGVDIRHTQRQRVGCHSSG